MLEKCQFALGDTVFHAMVCVCKCMFVLYYAQKMQFRKVALITLCEAFANRIFWIQNCSQESVNGEKNVTKNLCNSHSF